MGNHRNPKNKYSQANANADTNPGINTSRQARGTNPEPSRWDSEDRGYWQPGSHANQPPYRQADGQPGQPYDHQQQFGYSGPYASQPGSGQNSFTGDTRSPYAGNHQHRVGGYGAGERPQSAQGGGWSPYDQSSGQGSHWTSRGQRQPELIGKGPKGYSRSDERIQDEVYERLSHGFVDCSDVEVNVANGVVTLTGCVDSKASRRTVEDLVEDVMGVKDVEANLKIGAPGSQGSGTAASTRGGTTLSSYERSAGSTSSEDNKPSNGKRAHT